MYSSSNIWIWFLVSLIIIFIIIAIITTTILIFITSSNTFDSNVHSLSTPIIDGIQMGPPLAPQFSQTPPFNNGQQNSSDPNYVIPQGLPSRSDSNIALPTNYWYQNALINIDTTSILPIFTLPYAFWITSKWLQIGFLNTNNVQAGIPMGCWSNRICNPSFSSGSHSCQPGDKFNSVHSYLQAWNIPASFQKYSSLGPLYLSLEYDIFKVTLIRGMPTVPITFKASTTPIIIPNGISILKFNSQDLPVDVTLTAQNTMSWTIQDNNINLTPSNTGILWKFSSNQPLNLSVTSSSISLGFLSTETTIWISNHTLIPVPQDALNNYYIKSTVNAKIISNQVNLSYSYNISGSGNSYVYLLPHHLKYLKSGIITNLSIPGPRGLMSLVQLSNKQVSFIIPTIPVDLVETINLSDSQIKLVKNSLQTDISLFVGSPNIDTCSQPYTSYPSIPANVYGAGKTLARGARLVTISDKLNNPLIMLPSCNVPPSCPDIGQCLPTNRTDLAINLLINTLQLYLQQWLVGNITYTESYITNPNCCSSCQNVNICTNCIDPSCSPALLNNSLRYETTWGGICTGQGLNNSTLDFGNGWYNDHLLHYGYQLYAYAIMAHYDPLFISNNLPAVYAIVKDVVNPSSDDNYYIPTRHKDWYTWQSYTEGLFISGVGTNQQSTSEAMNCYYSASLLGKELNDNNLIDIGQICLATESASVKEYYFYEANKSQSWWPNTFKNQALVNIRSKRCNELDSNLFFCISPNQSQPQTPIMNLAGMYQIQLLPYIPITTVNPSGSSLNQNWFIQASHLIDQIISQGSSSGPNQIPISLLTYMYMIQAARDIILNRSSGDYQIKILLSIPTTSYDSGNSQTNAIFWIMSLQNGYRPF